MNNILSLFKLIMSYKIVFTYLIFWGVICCSLNAQTFLPIWEKKTMPNSKGLAISDSIVNEIIYKVGDPGMYVFEPSKSTNTGSAILIIPGGGYGHLAYQISGFDIAKWFNSIGVTAFVLKYRLPQSIDVDTCYKAPLQDAQRALRYIRFHSNKWNIDENKIGVYGCSAGGHLSACLSTLTNDWSRIGDELDSISFIPNFTILVSSVIYMDEKGHKSSRSNLLGKYESKELQNLFSCETKVTQQTPPAFIVHALNDRSVSCLNSLAYFKALKENNITKSSIHIFPKGGHGINLRNNPGSSNYWTFLAEEWLKEIKVISF